MNDHLPVTDLLCACGHRQSNAPASSGDTRCLVIKHPADLLAVFDDGREHDDLADCARLRFNPAPPTTHLPTTRP